MQGFVAMFYSPNNFNSLANINYNSNNTAASQNPLFFFSLIQYVLCLCVVKYPQ